MSDFDDIRAFDAEDLPEAYERLISDDEFRKVVAYAIPGVPFEAVAAKLKQCRTGLEFQKTFCYQLLERVMAQTGKCLTGDFSEVDNKRRYTFISNHRDIVLDSAFLDKLLIDAGFSTTCEIAIGDNLFARPWIKDLVRVNKAFIVQRSLPPRQMLLASKKLSEYMHHVINDKNDNIWIAQREGRAKDGNDRTQEAVLKMMAMGGTGSIVERLKQLHIVPLAISYEYDACDFLKAKEFQQKRDNPEWKKSKQDDVTSMVTGFTGYKGDIYYKVAPCIDSFLDQLPAETPKTEIFDIIAHFIDKQIHARYHLFANNYIALDIKNGDDKQLQAGKYTQEQKQQFLEYLQKRIAKIDLQNKDEEFLKERMITMYANPARNQLADFSI